MHRIKGILQEDGKLRVEIFNEQMKISNWTIVDEPKKPCAKCLFPILKHHDSEGWFVGCPSRN